MTPPRLHRISCVMVCALVAWCSSATAAWAQLDFGTPSSAAALATAAKASPELVEGLAKELGSTPEAAAGAAGVLFVIAKSLLPPNDFAAVAKAVPGMEALLAAVPAGVASELTATPGSTFAPGFNSSSPPGATMPPPDAITSAMMGYTKLGMSPAMIMKAIPFLSEYLKKHGGASIGSLLGGLFKTGK